MKRLEPVILALALCLALLSVGAVATAAPSSRPPADAVYVVQAGDTLYSIARRYGTTVEAIAQANGIVNPNLIYVGQSLTIPGAGGTTVTPPPAPPPSGGFYHTVQAGENLFRIGLRYGIPYQTLATVNGIPYPYYIYVGQSLFIPGSAPGGTPAPTAVPTPGPGPTNVPGGFGYGIQVHMLTQDYGQVLGAVQDLGLGWVKMQLEWSIFEPSRGNIDWGTLDGIVDAMKSRNLRVLFSVVHAPGWARSTSVDNGPPANYADYSAFVGALASRYRGRVDAYEIWNEQNLDREWAGDTLSAARYVQLLQGAYAAIKAQDSSAVVVAGAPAPTGLNDGVHAIDDRAYLRSMYAAGVAAVSDAIAAHPSGWANQPEMYCCNNDPTVPSFDDHPSFFFRQTLEDYHTIMAQYGDGGTKIWATEFGWGSNEGLGVNAPAGYEYVAWNTEAEQGSFITRAFAMGRAYGWVGPMFLWNLNFCPVTGASGEQCLFGLVRPDWSARPAYDAVKSMAKP